jgi:hypothetical protein
MSGDEVGVVDQAAGGALWVFEQGGLVMLLVGIAMLMLGLAQRRREGGSSRNVGLGLAIVVAASMSLYLAVWMGGDPIGAAVTSSWMYPFVLCMSLVLAAVQMRGRRRQHKPRRPRSAEEMRDLRYGVRPEVRSRRSRPERTARAAR